MTAPKQPKKRSYQQHGLHTVQKALASVGDMDGWLSAQGEVGQAAKALREKMIQDQGGAQKISEGERMTIDGTITAFVIMQSVGRFIGEMPCPVDKVRRRLFAVVPQWLTIFEGFRSAVKDLNELRIKRPTEKPLSLSDYLANGKPASPPATNTNDTKLTNEQIAPSQPPSSP